MADNKGVMIFIEIIDGKLTNIAQELLGAGRKLANDLTEELSALVVGSGVANIAELKRLPLAPIKFMSLIRRC